MMLLNSVKLLFNQGKLIFNSFIFVLQSTTVSMTTPEDAKQKTPPHAKVNVRFFPLPFLVCFVHKNNIFLAV